jgi:hypothetical protein
MGLCCTNHVTLCRLVARQKVKCTQSKAGGLGAVLRPPVGPGQSPGGGGGPGGKALVGAQGAKPSEAPGFY